ncbi:uncharacterized protein LOC142574213 [Dermacentor variabilis]|uniref:uncharacterized protein LOC142574213 n=1 Tax=Dermacentor variabilis TaxID=34621 RepID=UPI003F5B5393
MAHLYTFGILSLLRTAYTHRTDCRPLCFQDVCPANKDRGLNTYISQEVPDPDIPDPCPKVLCPRVMSLTDNKWLCREDTDPDEKSIDEYADPFAYADAWGEQMDDGSGERRKRWIDGIDIGCMKTDGSSEKDGITCMMTDSIIHGRYEGQCHLGVCKEGRCVSALYSTCATFN